MAVVSRVVMTFGTGVNGDQVEVEGKHSLMQEFQHLEHMKSSVRKRIVAGMC